MVQSSQATRHDARARRLLGWRIFGDTRGLYVPYSILCALERYIILSIIVCMYVGMYVCRYVCVMYVFLSVCLSVLNVCCFSDVSEISGLLLQMPCVCMHGKRRRRISGRTCEFGVKRSGVDR